MCRVFSCVVGRGCLLRPVHFLAKLYSPLPCFIPYCKAKFACYSRCFLTSYFCIPVPYNEKDIFWVLVLKVLVGLHRTILLQLFTGWGIGLDHCYTEWFALEMKRDHSVIFEIVSKTNHSISQYSKSMPQPVTLKKLKLNGSMKTDKTF